jgi:heterogeneous nuclear ribonucleoprotein F/H
LANENDLAKAIKMHRERLQDRYIEIFKSSAEEMEYVLEKAERQANQPWDNVIRMRGIPFKVI